MSSLQKKLQSDSRANKVVPIRVAHILPGNANEEVEEYVYHLATGMVALGVKSEIISTSEGRTATRLGARGLAVSVFPVKHHFDALAILSLGQFLHELKVDIVHAHLGFESLVATWVANQAGIKSVASVHGGTASAVASSRQSFGRGIRIFKNQHIDHFLPQTERLALLMKEQERVPNSRMTVVPPGVVPNPNMRSDTARLVLRSELGIDPNSFALLVVVDDSEVHGVDAVSTLLSHPQRPFDFTILVHGITDKTSMKKLKAQAAAGARLLFVSDVNQATEMLKALDAIAFLADSTDSKCYALHAKAMFAGIPQIAIRDGNAMLRENRTGLLIPQNSPESLAHAVKILWSNSRLCNEFGINSRQHAHDFYSIQAMAESVLQVYHTVLAGKKPALHH